MHGGGRVCEVQQRCAIHGVEGGVAARWTDELGRSIRERRATRHDARSLKPCDLVVPRFVAPSSLEEKEGVPLGEG